MSKGTTSYRIGNQNIYGAARLGSKIVNKEIYSRNFDVSGGDFVAGQITVAEFTHTENIDKTKRIVGYKQYEMANLPITIGMGNVLNVVTDRKVGNVGGTGYEADIVSYSDYYPYGMLLPGRVGSEDDSYRYGFQGQEMDDEIKGEGNSVNYKYRMHDPRIGRFFAVDPLTSKYPQWTPYQFDGNMPTRYIELEGLEPGVDGTTNGQFEIAFLNGTSDSYGWTWDESGRKWSQGDITQFTDGRNAFDYSYSDLSNKFKAGNDYGYFSKYPPSMNPTLRENEVLTGFVLNFRLGSAVGFDFTNNKLELLNHFLIGDIANGQALSFPSDSELAGYLSISSSFLSYAIKFERSALLYAETNGSLNGFNGNAILNKNELYTDDTFLLHAVLGGTAQIDATIISITEHKMVINYTIWDHFGADERDWNSFLPGLPQMYWLQHNAAQFRLENNIKIPNMYQYKPFVWNINVTRTITY